jgi:alpha-tubulin suppressor-like RCC1 family protein
MRRLIPMVLLLAFACNRGGGGGANSPPFLDIRMTLPEAISTDLVNSGDIKLAPVTGEPAPNFDVGTSLFQVNGITVTIHTVDEDGDGRNELLISYAASPFSGTSHNAELALYPRLIGGDGGVVAETPPVQVLVRLYTIDGHVLATGQANIDVNGQPIRMGGTADRTVQVLLACVPGAPCDATQQPIPVGKGTAQVTISRAAVCPTQSFFGDLYLFLLPVGAGTDGGTVTPFVKKLQGVSDFAVADAPVSLGDVTLPAGQYVGYAVLDVGQDFVATGSAPGPGDVTSDFEPVQIIDQRTTTVNLVLNNVVDVGPCQGLPQAPATPTVTGTMPSSPANNNNPFVVGTADPGTTVQIYTDAECKTTPIAEAMADVAGGFQIQVSVADNSTSTFSATARNGENFTSPCSQTRATYVEDSLAPGAPSNLITSPPSPSNNSNPTLNGNAEPGSVVNIYLNSPCSGTPLATVVSNAIGLFSQPITVPTNATSSIFAQATDAAGNASPCSTAFIYVENNQKPTAPTITGTAPTSPANNNVPTVLGTTSGGATVQVFADPGCNALLGSGAADMSGQFGVAITVADNTTTALYARSVDAAGNASDCTGGASSYIEDSSAPVAPILATTTPPLTGKTATPTVSGSAEANSTVRIYASAGCTGAILGAATTDNFGSFSAMITGVTLNGTTQLFGNATDAAGNTSSCTPAPLSYTHDDVAPTFTGGTAASAPSDHDIVLSWSAATDAGSAAIGSAPAYDICQSTQPGACAAQFVVARTAPPGATTFDVIGLAEGTRYYFVVRARDQAGNVDSNTKEITAKTLSTKPVLRVTAGAKHSCAVLANGEVRCWGDNTVGQIGDGTTTNRLTPTTVSGIAGAVAVTARSSHTCALLSNGSAQCWGSNSAGQLGNGSAQGTSSTPVAVSGLTGITALAAGGEHTCALQDNGKVWCWGRNTEGELGITSTSTTPQPSPVQTSIVTNAVAIASGLQHSCAVSADGTLYCWGSDGDGQIGDGTALGGVRPTPTAVLNSPVANTGIPITGVVGVAAGGSHTCALFARGDFGCWGLDTYGQRFDLRSYGSAPLDYFARTSSINNAVSISGGHLHSCVLQTDGSVLCAGLNDNGQLGNGTRIDTTGLCLDGCPTDATTVSNLQNVASVASGAGHTCALLADGTVRCWGANDSGQLGSGKTTPSLVPASTPLDGVASGTKISVGSGHVCALLSDGTAWCWGRNSNGQLGDGTTDNRSFPIKVTNLPLAISIASGGAHSCALLADGTARCWGSNQLGQLGDSTSGNNKPAAVGVQGLSDAYAIAAGASHNCALSHGTVFPGVAGVYCWGSGSSGQLGNGQTTDNSIPVAVSNTFDSQPPPYDGGPPVTPTELTAGTAHTCVLRSSCPIGVSCQSPGSGAFCWGNNAFGQIGINTTVDTPLPVQVLSLTNAVMIAAGSFHNCASLIDGTVKCWGYNAYGQLGDLTSTDRHTPTTVSGVANAVAVATGTYHSCALNADGTASCWGLNNVGQLGNGQAMSTAPYGSSTPIAVTGLSNAVAIGAGGFTTCALLSDGTVRCWGSNSSGQVGLGDTTIHSTAVPSRVVLFP